MRSSACIAFLFAFSVACGGAAPQPAPRPGTGSGSSTGSSAGSGGTPGSTDPGSGDPGSGDPGSGGTPTPSPSPSPSPSPAPMQTIGCANYVTCLNAAMSDTAAQACDMQLSMSGGMLFDAVEQCVGNYCGGMSGATARCTFATDGTPQNTDGTAAFDANGNPTGDCGTCLLNGDATLFGDACMPASDPSCTACSSQISACLADKS